MKPKSLLQAFPALLLPFAPTTWAAYAQSWSAGTFQLTAPTHFCQLDYGINMSFNSDGNIVIFRNSDPLSLVWNSAYTTPNCNGACQMVFQSDGNLVTYYGSQPLFNTATAGRGATMACMNQDPYLMIFDADGWLIWHATPKNGVPVGTIQGCPFLKSEPWRCI